MILKFSVERRKFLIIQLLLLIMIMVFIMPGMIGALASGIIILIISIIGNVASKKGDSEASALVLAIPVLLAATQNVYLGIAVNHLSSISLQILLSLHFLLILVTVALDSKMIQQEAKWCMSLVLVLLVHGVILFLVHPISITLMISSFRNILSCMLIYLYALSLGRKCRVEFFYRIFELIAWFVILFGLVEYLWGIEVWNQLGITQLWNLKGIKTNVVGVPLNWFSSEKIGGNQVRRMVSGFADPVNLGTYLFAAFIMAWYRKRKVLALLLALCCVLTISKGALLGFLIFMVVFVWYNDKSKMAIPLISIISVGVAVGFFQYSLEFSTGSMMAHIMGFINSLKLLFTNPFGLGIGSVGVLAGLFSSSLVNTTVAETGIGVIIAQLGWIGLICYIGFFVKLFNAPKHWKKHHKDSKILYYTLLLTFIANVIFNEVALSPNSCALYFIEMATLNQAMTGKLSFLNMNSAN